MINRDVSSIEKATFIPRVSQRSYPAPLLQSMLIPPGLKAHGCQSLLNTTISLPLIAFLAQQLTPAKPHTPPEATGESSWADHEFGSNRSTHQTPQGQKDHNAGPSYASESNFGPCGDGYSQCDSRWCPYPSRPPRRSVSQTPSGGRFGRG